MKQAFLHVYEELGHSELALRTFKALGGDESWARDRRMTPGSLAMCGAFDRLVDSISGVTSIGVWYALEHTTATLTQRATGWLQAKGIGKDQREFIEVHAVDDVAHQAALRSLMIRITEKYPCAADDIVYAAQVILSVYPSSIWGDVVRRRNVKCSRGNLLATPAVRKVRMRLIKPEPRKSHRPSSVLARPCRMPALECPQPASNSSNFRSQVIAHRFLWALSVHQQTLPTETANEYLKRLLNLYGAMFTAREIDRVESDLVRQGMAFFHVSGAGHESTATLAAASGTGRLASFALPRQSTRHRARRTDRRVLPKPSCSARFALRRPTNERIFSAPTAKILSLSFPSETMRLQAVGVAAAIAERPERPIAVCGLGDGGTQEGEFLEAVAEAVRSRLPLLFLVRTIGTRSRRQRVDARSSICRTAPPANSMDSSLHRVDGTDCEATDVAFSETRRGESERDRSAADCNSECRAVVQSHKRG